MSYSRKKRIFARRVIEQYKTVQNKPSTNEFRYSIEYRKLREYSEQLFLASGKKENLSPSDVTLSLILSVDRFQTKPMLGYVAHLAIASMLGLKSKSFNGRFMCSYCSGNYIRHGDRYVCDCCGYIGKADQYGFPVSLPATKTVRILRRKFHSLINEIRRLGISMQDCYSLVSYEAKVPLPLAHAGLCVTKLEIERLINGCEKVISNIPKGSKKG